MRPGVYYDVEFESFGVEPTRSVFRSENEAEVFTFAVANLKPASELFVACLRDGIDLGNLIVEVDGQGRTTLIAHEHRGFIASGLTVEVAIGALHYWLPMQGKIPVIQWADQ